MTDTPTQYQESEPIPFNETSYALWQAAREYEYAFHRLSEVEAEWEAAANKAKNLQTEYHDARKRALDAQHSLLDKASRGNYSDTDAQGFKL